MGNAQNERLLLSAGAILGANYLLKNSGESGGERKGKEPVKGRQSGEQDKGPGYTCPICGAKFTQGKYNEAQEHYELCLVSQNSLFPEKSPQKVDPQLLTTLEEFRKKLEGIKVNWNDGYVKFNILRQELLGDSLTQLAGLNQRQLRSEFRVEFVDESGLDAGGLTKEWLNLIVKELLSSKLNMFTATNTTEKRYRISTNNIDPLYYTILGRIIGKAILSNIPINCPLSVTILKQILDYNITREDVKHIDSELYKGMKVMETNSIEGIFFETFSINVNGKVVELLQGGENVKVTDENKGNYIELRVFFELYYLIENCLLGLKKGIFEVVPREFFEGVSFEELDLMICGNPVIDLGEWKRFTEYKGEFGERHRVVVWFWEYLEKLEQDKLKNFLYYVTGSYRVPIEGFEFLKTQRGDSAKFSIEPFNYFHGALPRAHTCFNRLDLPLYRSKQELNEALDHIILNYNQEYHLN